MSRLWRAHSGSYTMAIQRISEAFARAQAADRAALIAYLTAGYPSLAATESLVAELSRRGVDLVELGIPFSDPLADGPTIQWASAQALQRGVTLSAIFGMARLLRRRTSVPLVAMSYANPVYACGVPRFCRQASAAGFDGVIVPDLPPEEAGELVRAARPVGLATVFLAAPTSPKRRLKAIAACSTGFIYCVSLTGVTGARRTLPHEVVEQVRDLRRLTTLPIAVGFGVSGPQHVRWLASVADGVIVGSAIVDAITRAAGRRDLTRRVGRFVESLVRATGAEGAG